MRRLFPLLAIYTTATSVLVLLATLKIILPTVSLYFYTADIVAIAEIESPFAGALSNLGVLLWCATASICFFTAFVTFNSRRKAENRFMLASAILSSYLMFDDLFLIHERLVPRIIGLDQNIFYVVMMASVACYIILCRKIISRHQPAILILSLSFFFVSISIDAVLGSFLSIGDWKNLVEDGFKWLGIVSWCCYYMQAAYNILQSEAKSHSYS